MNDPALPTPAATPEVPQTSNRSALLIVFLVVFIDLLGFGIVLPMLPVFGDEYAVRVLPVDASEAMVGAVVGILMSVFSLMQFIFAPIWGRLSDRVGRRPILILGLVGSVCSYALFGYAASLTPQDHAALALALFFVTRIGAGIFGATIGTAQAVIADSTPPDKRKHGMAIIGAAFGIGFTFGPLIGFAAMKFFRSDDGTINYAAHGAIGYTAAALSFIALLLAIRLLPETRRFADTAHSARRGPALAAFRVMFGNSVLGPIVLTFFLATLGFAAFEVTLGLLLRDVFGFNDKEGEMFLFFAYVGFVLMLTQGVLYRRLAKKWREETFMTVGILFMGLGVGSLGLVCYLHNQNPESSLMGLLFAALTISVVGFAFLTPSAQALVSRRSESGEQGEVLGVNQSAAALARIIGPILGVTLYKATEDHMLPYLLGGLIVLMMLPMMPRIRRAGDATP